MFSKKHNRSEILEWIRRFIAENGYSPSVREIGRANGITSTSSVTFILDEFEDEGVLERTPKIARSIRLKDE